MGVPAHNHIFGEAIPIRELRKLTPIHEGNYPRYCQSLAWLSSPALLPGVPLHGCDSVLGNQGGIARTILLSLGAHLHELTGGFFGAEARVLRCRAALRHHQTSLFNLGWDGSSWHAVTAPAAWPE